MPLTFLDNNCYTLTSSLGNSDTILPISTSDAVSLCAALGADHTYLTLSAPNGTEVVRVSCSGGVPVIVRAQGDTTAMAFAKGKCACFKVNKIILDEYLQDALTGGCTPSVEIAADSVDYLTVQEPADGSCNWTIGLDQNFIDTLQECCYEDDCAPCVLPNGVYENATITVTNGKVCGISNGNNVLYTSSSCCGCQTCTDSDDP